ncbi:hypothetical protein FQN60_014520 [Etheostoma spectabile]|uniref:Uncharacterized protein n=1 Tax=Etheostoma spectabile TaxID=54343 RepID=A0A5J5DCL2_9PERO|nr:hypothetical protein FQN60_014520 [Etheostoma spectabile]
MLSVLASFLEVLICIRHYLKSPLENVPPYSLFVRSCLICFFSTSVILNLCIPFHMVHGVFLL